MNDPILLSLSRQVTALARRDLSAVELTQAYLDRIARLDVELRAYLCLDPEGALAAARAADDRRLSGTARSIYDGVPFAAKDNLCTADLPTTCASRMLEGFCAHYDATVIRRLREGGAILLGKTNMDEFGMGSTTEHSALFPTRNPLDHTRSPGGSSGGSAAAVAAGMAAFALGSDTGGSVRQPAAFCGTVGMKPTYGRLSRYGLVAFASSLDTVGVITHSVRDNASLLSFLSEPDPKDATSRAFAGDPSLGITGSVRGLRIGLCPLLLEEGIGDDVRAATLRAAEALRAAGAVNVKVDLPSISAALAAYYVISSAEASSNLARYDGVRYGRRASRYSDTDSLYRSSRSEGFGKEVKRRILLGTFVLSEGACEQYYQKALGIRALLAEELRQAFAACDVILCPTAPATAPLLGVSYDSPTDLYAGDLCTVPASLSGLPALSLPWEQDRNGMPIGIQLMGRAGEEALLYRVGSALEAMKGGSDHD